MKHWLFTGTILVALAGSAAGQDSHYWTMQFGNRARLLGGAVVGSEDDLSSVYYNPGAVALIDKPELLLAGTVFQIEKIRVSDALGPGQNLSNTRWFWAPSLFAGELRLKALGDNRVAYAFLTRYDSEFRLNEFADITDVLQASIPGISFASKDVEYETRLREYWFGGSWSRKIGEKAAIGVSPFIAVRNHRARAQNLIQALAETGQGGIAIESRDFSYQDWRFLAKVGISRRWERWDLGLTVTTPSLGLFGIGDGSSSFDESAVGQDVDQDGSEVTLIATDTQEGLDPDFQSPFSIAFGGARRVGKSQVHFTAEWFDGVGPMTLLAPEPFQAQSSGATVDYDTLHAFDSVLNAALGFEHRFENEGRLYAAFTTDFSAAAEDFRAQSAIASAATWDIYHLSSGYSFMVAGQELTLGVTYSFGHSTVGENDLEINPDLEVTYRRLTFVVGAGFLF
jgi:hypothetical protein